ncbi:MAG: hypothetical protein HRU04_09020 [Oceanospirillaceae bacterium]|nr:hypothetical protein [Oceanospirillaceae bacterium]
MKFDIIAPPRKFVVGPKKEVEISHTANVKLDTNEQITLFGVEGSEVDIVKKEWGYYLTSSINKRLASFDIDVYLVQNSSGNVFVMAVEDGGNDSFHNYLLQTNQKIIFNLSDLYCAS